VIKGDVQAVDRALRISKRTSEITGIDAPTKSMDIGFELSPDTPKPILRRIAAGIDPATAFADYASGKDKGKYGE